MSPRVYEANVQAQGREPLCGVASHWSGGLGEELLVLAAIQHPHPCLEYAGPPKQIEVDGNDDGLCCRD